MTDYIDTREPGWRRTTPAEDRWPDAIARIEYFEDGREIGWVREAPPTFTLPTEMHTVIRVTWAKGARRGAEDMLVNYLGGWCDLEGTIYTRPDVASSITGFEVLAEPVDARFSERAIRKATAKAVLDRVRERIAGHVQPGFEMRPDGTEDPESAGYVAGLDSALGHVEFIAREFGVES